MVQPFGQEKLTYTYVYDRRALLFRLINKNPRVFSGKKQNYILLKSLSYNFYFDDGGSSKILEYFLIFINVLFDPETTENPSPPVLKKNIQSILSTGRYRTNQDSVQKQVRKHILKGTVDRTSSNPPFNEWLVLFITVPFKRLPWICTL